MSFIGEETRRAARSLWWAILLRGIVLLLLGIVAVAWPGGALLALVFVVGIGFIIEGIGSLVFGVQARGVPGRGWMFAQGIISIIAGVVALVWPGLTALVLLYIVAFWAIVLGITEAVGSFQMRKAGVAGWYWSLIAGILTAIVGIIMVISPGAGIFSLLVMFAVFAILAGIATIVFAFQLRSGAKQVRDAYEDRD